MSIITNTFDGVVAGLQSIPPNALPTALGGIVYAKLADLPVKQVAIAYAVWAAAEAALLNFVANVFKDYPRMSMFSQISITIGSTYIGISEIEKRGLIGNKLKIFLIVLQALNVFQKLAVCDAYSKSLK